MSQSFDKSSFVAGIGASCLLVMFGFVVNVQTLTHTGIKSAVSVYDDEAEIWTGYGCTHMSRQSTSYPYGSCVTVHDDGTRVAFLTCSVGLRVVLEPME